MKTPTTIILSASALVAALGAQDPQGERLPSAVMPSTVNAAPGSDSATPAPARQSGVRIPHRASPIHTAPADNGHEYGIWACGADYKVSFHGAMTFVPYLGAGYPHNQPFSWTTQSVRIGGTELVHGSIKRNQAEYRYEYDLGDVTEAYDVLAEGLEQTFVIDQRPAGALGDLVVEGKIESLMHAAARKAAHGPVDFFDENGERIFTYGAAFAVDANGVKVPMATGYADGVVSLSLAAQTLETLAFPVTVDPLLGNVTLRTGPTSDVDGVMDCLREDEGVTDNVWYTYSRPVSATDSDLWVWRVSDQWAGADIAAYQDITTSWSTDQPQIASVSGANKTVTVFRRQFSGGDTWIRWHTHEYTDLTLGTAYGSRSNPSGEITWRPDIGGTQSFSTGSVCMLVFQRDTAATLTNTPNSFIAAVPLDVSGTTQGVLGTEVILEQSGSIDYERPSINQQSEGGANPVWAVTVQSFNNTITGDDWDLTVRIIDSAAATLAGPVGTEVSTADHKYGGVIAGQNGRYSVMYSIAPIASVATPKPTGVGGFDIRVRRIDFDGTSLSWHPNLSSLSELGLTTASRRWIPGGLAYDTTTDSHWMGTFLSTGSGSSYCALTGYQGGYVLRETIFSTSTGNVVVGGVSFDDDNNEFLVMVGDNDASSSKPVIGDVWQYATASSEVLSGTSCSTATLSWVGRGTTNQQHAIGSEFCEIRVSGAGAGDIHFMVLALSTRNVGVFGSAVAPGCRLLVQNTGVDYLGVLDFRVGSSVSWDQPIPEFLAADTVYFQDWIFNGSQFESTQRMAVDIVK